MFSYSVLGIEFKINKVGSFSIRRDKSCKNGGNFFFLMQITHVSEPNRAYSKNLKFKFRRKRFFKCGLIGRKWVVLIIIFSVSDVLLTYILIFFFIFNNIFFYNKQRISHYFSRRTSTCGQNMSPYGWILQSKNWFLANWK